MVRPGPVGSASPSTLVLGSGSSTKSLGWNETVVLGADVSLCAWVLYCRVYRSHLRHDAVDTLVVERLRGGEHCLVGAREALEAVDAFEQGGARRGGALRAEHPRRVGVGLRL